MSITNRSLVTENTGIDKPVAPSLPPKEKSHIRLHPITDTVHENLSRVSPMGSSSRTNKLSKDLILHLSTTSNAQRAPIRMPTTKISAELREQLFGLAGKGPVHDKHFGSKQMFGEMSKLYVAFRRHREDIRGLAAQIEAEAQKLDHG